MTPKRLFVFDIDGTLSDTTTIDDICYIRTFEQCFNVNLDGFDYTDFINVTDWGVTEELFVRTQNREILPKEMEWFKTTFLKDLAAEAASDPNQFMAVEGAIHFLNQLEQRADIAVALGTGAWYESAIIKLQTSNIPYQEVPLSNSNLYRTREAIVNEAIRMSKMQYGYDFKDITYFGDGQWDFQTCKKLEIPFIGIDYHQNGKLKQLGATEVYKDFSSMNLKLQQ